MLYLSMPMPRAEAVAIEIAVHARLRADACGQEHAGWGCRRWRTDWFRVSASEALESVTTALEATRVDFIPENGGGAGVRLKARVG